MTGPGYDRPLGAEVRPLVLGAVFLRRWRWTMLFPAFAVVITAVLVFVLPSRYTSVAIVLPENRQQSQLGGGLGSLAGLAGGLAGAAVGGGIQSPKLYADLVKTDGVIDDVLARQLTSVPRWGNHAPTLLEWLDLGGKSHGDSLYHARRYMLKRVTTEPNRETGTVTIRVELNDRRAATEVTSWFVQELDQFNNYRRQTGARNRRKFLEGRIAELEGERKAITDSLRSFYEANREYENAPALRFESRRREARLDQVNDVITTVRRDFENARTEEVNDTPLLTVVQQPTMPERRSFPQRKLLILLAAVGSGLIGMGVAYLLESVRKWNRTDTEGQADMAEAWREARRGIGRVLPLRSRRDGSGQGE